MAFCARCGHDLGEASVCARCGTIAARYAQPGAAGHTSVRMRAVDASSAADDGGDTAERPAVATDTMHESGRHAAAPVVPPPSVEPSLSAEPEPTNARFPLFADEVVSPPERPAPAVAPPSVEGRGRSMSDLLPWVLLTAAAVGLLLVAAVWLLFRPGGDASASDASAASPGADAGTRGAGGSDGRQDGADDESGDQADAKADGNSGGKDDSTGSAGDKTVNVAATATALVPSSAPPGQDVDGRPVRYTADQMFDGDPTTTWRMSGDGTDALITIRLDEPVAVSRVGLINGYAKEDVDRQGRTVRWYPRNRRITTVTWSFDDGSILEQDLRQRPEMQMTKVDGEVTRTIRLRLVDVTAPMPGRLGRNYTAISEIRIKGVPAG
jgi:hypothetical protein